jgi:Bifunctional DNA primase/polymerase, N-terminal
MENNRDHIIGERSVNDMVTAALGYLSLGYRPIPLIPGNKRSAIKWAVYRARPPTEDEIRSWFGCRLRDIAVVTGNGVVVIDVDDPAMVSRVLERCGETPMRCQTPSGMHLYYATPEGGLPTAVRVNRMPIDIRSDGAHAVCPWSRNAAGVPYEWVGGVVPAADLPPIEASWLRERTPKQIVTPDISPCDPSTAVRRARGYLAHIEGAISGQRGHDRTFRVACVLAIKFGLTLEQAWPLMREWNEQCEPPWSDKEIAHKLQDAFKLRVL